MIELLCTDYNKKATFIHYNLNSAVLAEEILGLWLNETESNHHWMQIFDELKNAGERMFCSCPWTA